MQDIGAAIRQKNGSEATYRPAQMAAAILAIPTGGGADTSDATALAADIADDKTAYIASGKVQGAMPNLDNYAFDGSSTAPARGYTSGENY